ncbi:MAG: right-handed parallel beta-helix repeat-containing protein [Acidobacteriota bacterium]
MGQAKLAVIAVAAFILSSCSKQTPEAALREALTRQTMGIIRLPDGDLVLNEPLRLPKNATEMSIRGGALSRLIAGKDFKGPALIVIEGGKKITLTDFVIDGNRGERAKPLEMAPPENAFRIWYADNGILADQVEGLEISQVTFHNVVNFPVLVSRSSAVRIHDVTVEDSGSLNAKGRNNLTGGILLEEGTADFEVHDSSFRNIRGNALWTHSLLTSPQLLDGKFSSNKFELIGRDAIQVGHAKRVVVEDNKGREIGYPFEVVDVENGGTPVVIDTAGDVEGAQYQRNHFDEVNGKCIDLDGFHDGIVTDNSCINRKGAADYPNGHFGIVMNNTNPNTHSANIELNGNLIDGAKYGGLFVMGSGNHIANNRFVNLNLAGCNESSPACVYKKDEPEMLQSGIYVGKGPARPEEAKGNVIRNNKITGHKMATRCIAVAPGIVRSANTIEENQCENAEPVPAPH